MPTTLRSRVWPLLQSLGVDAVFGNPGSTELTMLDGFPTAELDYHLGLQEAAVVMMADGYAQTSRKPVLVNLHTGPGLGNTVGSLLTARWSRAPLIVTAGQQVRAMITDEHWLVNVDATTLPKPTVKWSFEPPRPEDVPAALARAVQTALTPPAGPVFVSLPMDDWEVEIDGTGIDDLAARRIHSRTALSAPNRDHIAAALREARSPVLVLGAAAVAQLEDWKAAHRFAEHAGLSVWAAPALGRNVFDETSPRFQGFLPFGAAPIGHALADHDLILVVGAPVFTCYPYAPGRYIDTEAQLIQITDDPAEAARAPLGTAFLADPGQALADLAEAVEPIDRMQPPLRRVAVPPRPGDVTAVDVYAHLAANLPAGVRITHEAPSSLGEFHDHIRLREPDSFLTTPSGGLGYGLAAGVGAAIADPGRPVLAIIGDGSLHYSATALWTAARAGAAIVTVVLANGEYAILKAFADFNELRDPIPGLDLPGLDAVAVARGYGVPGRRVDDPVELAAVVADALRSGRPALFEIGIDAAVPPLL
ncbi:benzoylformate decarboxylase [Nocardia sp. NPDC004722]